MSESTNVGSIVAKLKIDGDEWARDLAKAETQARSLGRANPKIRVETTGTKQAAAELAAVEVAENKVSASSEALARMRAQSRAVILGQAMAQREATKTTMDFTQWTQRSTETTRTDTDAKEKNADANRKVDSTAKQAGGSIHLLYSSLAMLAPAAVPLAGVAVAAAGALGAMGAAGVLSIFGVKKAMEEGNKTGVAYTTGIARLKEHFGQLAATSAEGTLAGFNGGLDILNQKMPTLNRQMGAFSSVLGNVAANGLTGILGLFTTLDPVIRGFSGYIGQLSARFATIGSSNGLRSFGDYALAVMPQVMATLESLVRGVGNLIGALAPLGGVALTSLKLIGDILSGIPTEVLTLLISGALGAYAAFSAWSALIPIIQSFGLMLNMSLGPIGLVVAGVGALIGVMIGSTASTKDATAATMGYTSALQRDNGIIAENVRNHTAEQIAKSKAAEAGQKLGLSLNLLTDAAMGNQNAQKLVNGELDRLEAVSKDASRTTLEMGGVNVDQMKKNAALQASIKTIRDELGNQNSALNEAVQFEKRFNEAKGATNGTVDAQGGKLAVLAGMYGTSVANIAGAEEAERKTADQLAKTTFQMQLQNDAGGLLKMQLDLLAGKSLSFEQAQNSFEKQLQSTTTQLTNQKAQVDAHGNSLAANAVTLEGNSEAAVTNRGNLLQLVQSAQLSAEAFGTMTGSSEDARQKLIQQRDAIINNAVANGQNRGEVEKYIDSVLRIPASVPPTKVQVDQAALAAAEAQLANLARQRVASISAQVRGGGSAEDPSMTALDPSSFANGGKVNYLARGGFPAFKSRGTDTVPAMLTPGEIVMKKQSVDSIGADRLLHANATGQLPSGGNTFNIYEQSDPVATAYTTARVLTARAV